MYSNSAWSRVAVAAAALFLTPAVTGLAQVPKPEEAKKQDPPKTEEKRPPKPGQPKPYKEVITAEAKTEAGMFLVHRMEDKVYFELPAEMLGRVMLWHAEIEQLPAGMGYGGAAAGHRVVRWTRRNNKVYLRAVSYAIRSEDPKSSVERAVEAASLEPIIMAFDVEAEGKDHSAVLDVTRMFTTDVPELSARATLGGAGIDAARSYVERVKPFPRNIETEALITYTGSGGSSVFGAGRRGGGGGSVTALIHYSLDLLPNEPMRGRLYDSRVGFFTEDFEDYGRAENRVVERQYITRYRLEKKNPGAALSDPVKPIVYYISAEVPAQWHPYLKKAVEAWQQAFETAGFTNAIVCREAPSAQEDPDWDPQDARYSVIRWAPTTFENAMGPSVHDPRSGEILSAHIIVWHNILKLAETWYFTQVGPLDPRASHLPLPQPIIGEMLQYIVCHEVGHTLGLEHNFKGSSAYTVAQLRDPAFTAKNGDEASIMDYGRCNYVAQPGDNARLIPTLGPYDRFAIEWGYKPFESALTPDAEKPFLDQIASRQVENPQLRFGNSHFEDPGQQMEDLGSDPVEATRLGLKNIARVVKMLVPATTRYGENYDLLQEMFNATVGQRSRELHNVLNLIGGVVQTDYHAGRGDTVFRPVPREKQVEAMRFLLETAFTTPRDLLDPAILNRIEPSGVSDLVLNGQRSLLANLLDEARIKRMLDNQALNPAGAYFVGQMVGELQDGIWKELTLPRPAIDLYRRNLQRVYLEVMRGRLTGDGATQTDLRPLGLGALRQLARSIDRAIPVAADPVAALHLQDCRRTVERIMNPRP